MKRRITHFLLPHEGNNHRAKALHVDTMVFYVLALAVFHASISIIHSAYPSILGYATNIHVQELLEETNNKREKEGLGELQLNKELSDAAAKKATDMFSKNYWAHVAPDGTTPWDFIVSEGYKYTVAGENLAKNFQDSTGVVNAWMASPSHKDNLLKPQYKEVGFAVVNGVLQGEETTLVVQMFGSRPGAVLAQNGEPAEVSAITVLPESGATSQQLAALPSLTLGPFSGSVSNPKVDIISLRRDVSMVLAGFILAIFIVDMYIAFKKHTVRAVGSSVAHIIFFLGILFSMNMVLRGAIL